jgi:hypothetical protein
MTLMTLHQQMKIYKWNNPSIRVVTNNYLLKLRSVQISSDDLEYSVIQHLSGSV